MVVDNKQCIWHQPKKVIILILQGILGLPVPQERPGPLERQVKPMCALKEWPALVRASLGTLYAMNHLHP